MHAPETPDHRHPEASSRVSAAPTAREIAREFLRISLLGFGGPNAHLALMLDAIVERRRWIDREHFLHLVAMTHLLPGPNSSEVALHIGYTQRGWRGALAAGGAFLGPTFLLMVACSALYFRYGTLPAVQPLFWGLKPVIVAVILGAGWRLGRASVRDRKLLLLATAGAAVALWAGRWQVAAMVAGAAIGWWLYGRRSPEAPLTDAGGRRENTGGRDRGGGAEGEDESRGAAGAGGMLAVAVLVQAGAVSGGAAILGSLFLLMLGIGATMFGGGYVLVALLQPYAVDRFGWLDSAQFLDGVALSQAVPGPISTLAAFVGYAGAGIPGAVMATLGIYLPALAAVLLIAPHLERWRHRFAIRGALQGVNAVVAGAVVGTALTLTPAAVPDPVAGLLLGAGSVAVLRGATAARLVLAGLGAGLLALILGGA